MMKWIAIIACIIAAAANSYEYENLPLLRSDVGFRCDDAGLTDSFLRMFQIWNQTLDGRFNIFSNIKSPTITIVYGEMSGYAAFTALAVDAEGKTICTISIDPRFANILDSLMLHEIGHCLGMDHSEDRGAIMYRSVAGHAPVLSADDVIGICTRYGVAVPSTVNVGIQFRRTGCLHYKFRMFGIAPESMTWRFGDASQSSIDIVPVHKFKTKGMTQISASVGEFTSQTSVPIK